MRREEVTNEFVFLIYPLFRATAAGLKKGEKNRLSRSFAERERGLLLGGGETAFLQCLHYSAVEAIC